MEKRDLRSDGEAERGISCTLNDCGNERIKHPCCRHASAAAIAGHSRFDVSSVQSFRPQYSIVLSTKYTCGPSYAATEYVLHTTPRPDTRSIDCRPKLEDNLGRWRTPFSTRSGMPLMVESYEDPSSNGLADRND